MYYGAYGSNMNLGQMKYRCPKSNVICNGVLVGWKLVFNIHADIIYTGCKNDLVPVVIWNIHKSDWNALDMYEGYPRYYVKKNVEVILDNGREEQIVVYVMNENRKGISPPGRCYFGTILTGYEENGIDKKTLYNALEYSMCNSTKYNQYNVRKGANYGKY